jgi:hypothetical protein
MVRDDEAMYLAYVDDSGDSRHGTTLTALLVPSEHWRAVLDAWLEGRRAIHDQFGVAKHAELHANELYKGRGSYCETPEQDRAFGSTQREAAGRIVLAALARQPDFHLVTMGTPERSKPATYARFVALLEDWAERINTELLIFYDGPQGIEHDPDKAPSRDREELASQWEDALRNAAPFRQVHRGLDIGRRRVIEDPIMQDSRYSQLIQAVDLIAYGAFQRHRQDHPEIWGTNVKPSAAAIRAYMRLAKHWSPASDYGVIWKPETQEPPA